MNVAERAKKFDAKLIKLYPDAKCSLDYNNPLELLVATILSAQCADARVNKVTKDLFAKYRKAADYAGADIEELERDVRSTGFYRNKAKAIKSCCADLVVKHGGKVPDTMDELTALQGVGRKTANVILGNAYNMAEGIVVDTHVGRIALRMQFSSVKNPDKTEKALMELIPKKEWTAFSHRVILFGRETCQAKKPQCASCPVTNLCPWPDKTSD